MSSAILKRKLEWLFFDEIVIAMDSDFIHSIQPCKEDLTGIIVVKG